MKRDGYHSDVIFCKKESWKTNKNTVQSQKIFYGDKRSHRTDHERGNKGNVNKQVNILYGMALNNDFQLHMITVSFLGVYIGLRDRSTVNKDVS
jgi:hypothetical protein